MNDYIPRALNQKVLNEKLLFEKYFSSGSDTKKKGKVDFVEEHIIRLNNTNHGGATKDNLVLILYKVMYSTLEFVTKAGTITKKISFG